MNDTERKLLLTTARRVMDDAHKIADALSVVSVRYRMLYSDMSLLVRLLESDLEEYTDADGEAMTRITMTGGVVPDKPITKGDTPDNVVSVFDTPVQGREAS